MRNPLNRRYLRELKSDFAKYIVIFLFLIMLIGLVSGFLVADNSVSAAYDEGFTKYNLENGNFVSAVELAEETIDEIEEKADVTIYELSYIEEELSDKSANIRIYQDRTQVNLECLMSGQMPEADNEIALDRMFAQNNEIEVGDTIELAGKELVVSGLVALPDYSCLFENNSDMMFDSIHFSVAVMTGEGFERLGENNLFYCYAWKYPEEPEDDAAEKILSDDLLETLNEKTVLTSYIPRYSNKAINFTGEDMSGDKAMFLLFDYIVVAILAFVFAITASNTIAAEAGVIGTLRASGYTRGELVRHYMVLPILVMIIAAGIGNLIGYTAIKDYMVEVYYNSYSLCTYVTLWNAEAFVDTTVIPVILMFVINLLVLTRKLKLSPLKFLRRELTKHTRKKAFRLNTRIPFLHRFRLRVLFQNIPNYITLFVGIVFAALIVVFGFMFGPLLDDYAELVSKSMFAEYQYILKAPVDTENKEAEKYCVTSLNTLPGAFMEDEITIYGIEEDSRYIDAEIPEGKVLLSNGYMDKFSLSEGDTITLKNPYGDEEYQFEVAGEHQYDAALAVFMDRADFLDTFDKDEDYFSGYFSNEELTDIKEAYVASVITEDDLTKVSQQLKVSMGDFMLLFQYFGAIMFLLLMYLLSKQIIEKNAQSISMVKILGFYNTEIGSLYIVATSIVVLISLLLAVPLVDEALRWMFHSYLYTEMTGYVPYIIDKLVYVKMVVMGIVCYGVVILLQMRKIKKIPMDEALKNVE